MSDIVRRTSAEERRWGPMKHLVLILLTTSTLFMGSCVKQHQPLFLPEIEVNRQEYNGLKIHTKALSELEAKMYFDRYVLSKGYHPIQISIENLSNRIYTLHANDIGLPLERSKKVARTLHESITKPLVVWGVGSYVVGELLTLPFTIIAAVSGAVGIALAIAFAPPIITTIAISSSVSQERRKFYKELRKLSINPYDYLIIKPSERINKVIFVRKEHYYPHFYIDLVAQDTGEKVSFKI